MSGMRIDLHVHTRGSDGRSSPDTIVERAIMAGLDGIAITDHHKVRTPDGDAVAELGRKCGLRVFRGCEYSSASGHMLLFGVDDALVSGLGRYADPRTVVERVSAAGGAVVVSHPFRPSKWAFYEKVADLRGVAAWEGYNGQCGYMAPTANDEAMKLAREKGRRTTGGSDTHDAKDIGLASTVFPEEFDTDRGLVRALKRGGYRAVLDTKRLAAYRVWRDNRFRYGASVLDKPVDSGLPLRGAGSDPLAAAPGSDASDYPVFPGGARFTFSRDGGAAPRATGGAEAGSEAKVIRFAR